jgi:GT2 family glycosyltransferase
MQDSKPFISVVIATYNRPQRLKNCLESLTHLDYPSNRFEVIVVDDGSPTSLEGAIAPLRDRINIQLIRQDNAGCGAARNTGAKHARGKFLAFTDDDCTHPCDWLKNLASRLTRTPDAMIGGRTINLLTDNLFSSASQLLIDYLFSYYNADPDRARYFNSIALATDAFCALGGFDTSVAIAAEDREFCDRWLSKGYKMIYAPEVLIYHFHHLDLRSFWRQHFNYGRGAFCFQQVSSKRNVRSNKMQPKSFYLNLLFYPLKQKSTQPKILLTALFFLSQVATVFGLFWEKYRQGEMQKIAG